MNFIEVLEFVNLPAKLKPFVTVPYPVTSVVIAYPPEGITPGLSDRTVNAYTVLGSLPNTSNLIFMIPI